MHMFVKAAETITKLKLHASTTVDSPLWPADHLNLSTESMHLTWVGCCSAVERNTHTHTAADLSKSDRLPTVKASPSAFPSENSSTLRASPSFSRPLCSLSFFSSSLSFTPGSFDHLRRRALWAAVQCVSLSLCLCVCQTAAPLIIPQLNLKLKKDTKWCYCCFRVCVCKCVIFSLFTLSDA